MNHTKFCAVGTLETRTFLEKLKLKCNEISDRPTIGPNLYDVITQYRTAPMILISIQYFPSTVVKGDLHNNSLMRG